MSRSIFVYAAFILAVVIIGYLTYQHINQQNHIDSLRSANNKLKMNVDTLTAQLDSFHHVLLQKDSLLSQCQARSDLLLSKWDLKRLKRQGLSNPVDDLKSDLIANQELIQQEGVLGGRDAVLQQRQNLCSERGVGPCLLRRWPQCRCHAPFLRCETRRNNSLEGDRLIKWLSNL